MNTGIQDAVDLGHALCDVLREGATDATLDGYQERRRPVAQRVVALTDRATRIATLTSPIARFGRNTAIGIVGRIPAAQHRLALQIAGLPDRGAPRGAADEVR